MGPDTAAAMELASATLGKVQALAARRWAAMAATHARMPMLQILGSSQGESTAGLMPGVGR